MFELIIKLPNDLKFRNVRNCEIRKNSNLAGDIVGPSLLSRKKTLTLVVKSNAKKRCQNFLVLSSFPRFLCFVPNILSHIVEQDYKD